MRKKEMKIFRKCSSCQVIRFDSISRDWDLSNLCWRMLCHSRKIKREENLQSNEKSNKRTPAQLSRHCDGRPHVQQFSLNANSQLQRILQYAVCPVDTLTSYVSDRSIHSVIWLWCLLPSIHSTMFVSSRLAQLCM